MALEKEHNYKGILANYWKINGIVEDIVENKTTVTVGLYANKDIRDLDIKNFLINTTFIFEGVDYSREQLYTKMKEPIYFGEEENQINRNILSDAVDC